LAPGRPSAPRLLRMARPTQHRRPRTRRHRRQPPPALKIDVWRIEHGGAEPRRILFTRAGPSGSARSSAASLPGTIKKIPPCLGASVLYPPDVPRWDLEGAGDGFERVPVAGGGGDAELFFDDFVGVEEVAALALPEAEGEAAVDGEDAHLPIFGGALD